MKVPNRIRIGIIDDLKNINTNTSTKLHKSVLGKIQAAQQIEPKIFETTKQQLYNLTIPLS